MDSSDPAPVGGKGDDVNGSANACLEAVPEGIPVMDVDDVFAELGTLTGPIAISGDVFPGPLPEGCEPIETSIGSTICASCTRPMEITGEEATLHTPESCLFECGELVRCTMPPGHPTTVWGTPRLRAGEESTIEFEKEDRGTCQETLCPSADLVEEARSLIAAGELGGDRAFDIEAIGPTQRSFRRDLNGDGMPEAAIDFYGRFGDSEFEDFRMVFASQGEHLCGQRYVGVLAQGALVGGGSMHTFPTATNGLLDVEVILDNSEVRRYRFDGDRYVLEPAETELPALGDVDAGECSDFAQGLPVFSPTALSKLGSVAIGQDVAIRGDVELGNELTGCQELSSCNDCKAPLVVRDKETTVRLNITCTVNTCSGEVSQCWMPLGDDEVVVGKVVGLSAALGSVSLDYPSDHDFNNPTSSPSCGGTQCKTEAMDRVVASSDLNIVKLSSTSFGTDLDLNGQPELFAYAELDELGADGRPMKETFIFITSDAGQCGQAPSTSVPGGFIGAKKGFHNGMLDILVKESRTGDARLYRFDGTDYQPVPGE